MGNFTGFQKSQDYYQHPRIGLIKRIQTEHGPQLIEHTTLVDSPEAYEQWQHRLDTLHKNDLHSTLFLPCNRCFQPVGYCGGIGDVFMLFEDFMFQLTDEIQNRRQIGHFFPEPTVVEMLYRLIKASRDMELLGFKMGGVAPGNILVDEDGNWRISCQYSSPGSQFDSQDGQIIHLLAPEELQTDRSFTRATSQQTEGSTLSPMEENQHQIRHSTSEIFTIGITILEICSLQPSVEIYQKGFDLELIAKRIKKVSSRYSSSLVNMLSGILEINPANRPTADQIIKVLKPFETSILSNLPISFDFASRKPSTLTPILNLVTKSQKITPKTKSHQVNTQRHLISRSNSCFSEWKNIPLQH